MFDSSSIETAGGGGEQRGMQSKATVMQLFIFISSILAKNEVLIQLKNILASIISARKI